MVFGSNPAFGASVGEVEMMAFEIAVSAVIGCRSCHWQRVEQAKRECPRATAGAFSSASEEHQPGQELDAELLTSLALGLTNMR